MSIFLVSLLAHQSVQPISYDLKMTNRQQTILLIAVLALGCLIIVGTLIYFFFKERKVRQIRPDGTIYEGGAKGFYAHGRGKLIFPDNRGYIEVEMNKGQLVDGPVKMVSADTNPFKFEGDCKKGVVQGILTSENGDIYQTNNKNGTFSINKIEN